MVFVPHWPKRIGKKFPREIKFDRVLEVCARLDNPHLKIPKVIHIAGTNGKGSITSYITNILVRAGFRVHKYTSPHLINFNERIVLNNTEISDEYLFDILERTRRAFEIAPIKSGANEGLTLFEATTIAAFIAFSEVYADFLVIEVGMGGRMDPTNIIENKILSIIAPIGLDHQDFLGDTEEMIAHEKCGIIKKSIPIISAKQKDEVMRVIEYHAKINNSPIYRYDYEFSSEFISGASYFDYLNLDSFGKVKNRTSYSLPKLPGIHQTENASVAIAACEILNSRYMLNLYYEDIDHAIYNTFWPARMQKILSGKIKDLLPSSWDLYLDGAHNAHGAESIARWIKEYSNSRNVYVVFGTTRGKDLRPYLLELKDYIKYICCICVSSETNAYRGSEILDMARSVEIQDADSFEYLNDALFFLNEKFIHSNNSIVIICGSLYLAADVLKINNGII